MQIAVFVRRLFYEDHNSGQWMSDRFFFEPLTTMVDTSGHVTGITDACGNASLTIVNSCLQCLIVVFFFLSLFCFCDANREFATVALLWWYSGAVGHTDMYQIWDGKGKRHIS